MVKNIKRIKEIVTILIVKKLNRYLKNIKLIIVTAKLTVA